MAAEADSWDWVVSVEESGTAKYVCDDPAFRRSLGMRLSKLRENAGMTLQDIEDLLGIRKNDVLAIESGLLEIDEQTEEQFAMAFGLSVTELRQQSG